MKMPEWKDEKYSHLLQPSLFSISSKNIIPTIELFKKHGIDEYISNRALRRNIKKQSLLFEYIKKHNIPLVEEDKQGNKKLSKIINESNNNLKTKYHIDLDKLEREDRDVHSLGD